MTEEVKDLLRPAIKYCLSRSLGIRDLLESARWVFLDEAIAELNRLGQEVNISRLSLMTGLQRPIVQELLANRKLKPPTRFTDRVIATWRNNKRYLLKNGRPKPLNYESGKTNFCSLVQSLSKDLSPGTVLFDLKRLDQVDHDGDLISLKSRGLRPNKSTDDTFKEMINGVTDYMLGVIENQNYAPGQQPNYHRSITIDNVDPQDLDLIRSWVTERFSKFQKEVEGHLANYDRDLNPEPDKEGGHRISVGVFSRT